jgi:hypothetical protein
MYQINPLLYPWVFWPMVSTVLYFGTGASILTTLAKAEALRQASRPSGGQINH